MRTNNPDEVLTLFRQICTATSQVLAVTTDWTMSGERQTQYRVDLAVDAECFPRLLDAGFGVLSEESGVQYPSGADPASIPTVVVDPLDGSTNASLGLPYCATALCLVVDGKPLVANVTNLVTGECFEAVRGRGATCDGQPIRVGAPVALADAIIAVNGIPGSTKWWRQYRAMGSTALDIAAVARGGFDGYVDFDDDAIGVWDYLAAFLIVEEAGGVTADALSRDPFVLDPSARRAPVVASSPELLVDLMTLRSP